MNFKKLLHYLSFSGLIVLMLSLDYFIYSSLIREPIIKNIELIWIAIGLINVMFFTLLIYVIYMQGRVLPKVERQDSLTTNHEFVANIIHELRTPLTGVLGFVGILKKTKLDEEQKEFVQTIEKSSNNLLRLVNDILDHSKASNGKIELDNHTFDLLKTMEESIESYITKTAEKYIELGLYIDPTLPSNLIGDSTKISQVILNLLSNAIKFTPEHGLVNISIVKLKEDNESIDIKFFVKDSGIGIRSDKLENIFEAFSQAESSTSREFGGTGLGLSISNSFVEVMGGKLELESIENTGTTFFFTLTLKKEEFVKEREYSDLNQKNVAYVIPRDDVTYELIDKNLEYYIRTTKANYRTYYQDEVLNLEEQELPDILFINHRYSGENGVLDKLLALKTKIILITCADTEKITTLYEKSVSNFVFKPINYSKTMQVLSLKEEKTKEKNPSKVNVSREILVVEDNIINQKLIHRLLLNLNMTVTIANNGLEALELYKKNSYSIVLMDIQMPVMSGIEATKEILAYEQSQGLKHTPIIALTANNSKTNIAEYLEVGMDGFLGKPIDLKKLQMFLDEYLLNLKEHTKTILLYKENQLTNKIYTSILEQLGYTVDACFEKDIFIEKFSTQVYSMVLFDTSSFESTDEKNTICSLARTSRMPLFAFSENTQYNSCATLLSPSIYGKELQYILEKVEEKN